ncbi:TPA: hypothetical protein O7U43_RS28370, partial [Escherichia coli]
DRLRSGEYNAILVTLVEKRLPPVRATNSTPESQKNRPHQSVFLYLSPTTFCRSLFSVKMSC